jgi:Cytochrome C oxidase, cbb3-type, subunit III
MHRLVSLIGFAILVAASSGIEVALGDPIYVDQGTDWTAVARADFYTRDQGSRLIDLAWLQALKRSDGQPFLSDSLSRYGFLPNPGNTADLPIGVHTTGPRGFQIVGITCAACHTRQIEVDGKTYRIDGGPAFIDFQAFLSDLDKAVGDVTASDASFAAFAAAVLQSATPAAADVAALRPKVDAWYRRFHAFAAGTLPPVGWGLGRIDAVGIIFNRLSGLDVGPPPDLLIPENMKIANAPVRFPFLWNSPVQDKTDWAGFVINGNDLFALSRNTGQALAFANFEPKHLVGPIFNYLYNNSINFDGLNKLEGLLRQMGPPKWPFAIDSTLAADGAKIFDSQCSQCHGIRDGEFRSLFSKTWATCVRNVGTDTRQFDELGWKAKTGVLAGAIIPGIANTLKDEDYAVSMMFTAVAGSIAQHLLLGDHGRGFGGNSKPNGQTAAASASGSSATPDSAPQPPPVLQDSAKACKAPNSPQPAGQPESLTIEKGTLLERTVEKGAYEARVLQGIWAAAPYLHNGSVASLVELLKPPAERKSNFSLGPNYDTNKVGLAATQPGSNTRFLTDCSDINSGNSRCGHEWGTTLGDQDKKALLEYLKTL